MVLRLANSPDADLVARGLRAKLANVAGGQSRIGDLLLLPAPCIACLPEATPTLQAAGWQVLPQWPDDHPPVLKATIAAPRLDAAVAGAFRLSRGEAQTAIEYGFVFHNFRLAQRRNLECRAGDQLVFTGKGRAELVSLEQPTRAGRLWLEFRIYPA